MFFTAKTPRAPSRRDGKWRGSGRETDFRDRAPHFRNTCDTRPGAAKVVVAPRRSVGCCCETQQPRFPASLALLVSWRFKFFHPRQVEVMANGKSGCGASPQRGMLLRDAATTVPRFLGALGVLAVQILPSAPSRSDGKWQKWLCRLAAAWDVAARRSNHSSPLPWRSWRLGGS